MALISSKGHAREKLVTHSCCCQGLRNLPSIAWVDGSLERASLTLPLPAPGAVASGCHDWAGGGGGSVLYQQRKPSGHLSQLVSPWRRPLASWSQGRAPACLNSLSWLPSPLSSHLRRVPRKVCPPGILSYQFPWPGEVRLLPGPTDNLLSCSQFIHGKAPQW